MKKLLAAFLSLMSCDAFDLRHFISTVRQLLLLNGRKK
jgi:hypothetical protein